MPCTIEDLSTELNLWIAAYLRRHNLTRLMQATKYFYSLVEPLLWKSIEFHKPGFRKDCNGYVGMQDQKWFYMDVENSLSSLKYDQVGREFAERAAEFPSNMRSTSQKLSRAVGGAFQAHVLSLSHL